jgi:Trk K+ transport system NAD-binding subunit
MRLGDGAKGDGSLKLVKVPVMHGCIAFGKSLGELGLYDRYGVDLLFLWKAGKFLPSPGREDLLDASTMLFLLGRASAVSAVLDREFCIREAGEATAVIAGYGDVGKAAYQELTAVGIRCTVIDRKSHGIPEVVGNAEDEAVLRAAGVEKARFVIAAVNSDGVNIFTTLVARNLNPSAKILARASEPAAVEKLYKAGADYVALLPTIGGQVIAGIILEDIVRVLVDLPDGEKVLMKHLSRHAGTTVGELVKRSGVRIVGIEGPGRSVVRPGPGEPVRERDSVIAVGGNGELRKLIGYI